MAKYKIHLVKLGGARVGNEARTGGVLKSFFDQVIESSQSLGERFSDGAETFWSTSCPEPAGHELLIYVVRSSMDSIVKDLPGLRGRASPNLDDGGFTAWVGELTGSEVYTESSNDPTMLAKLVFHEAMHNKLHAGGDLHAHDGLAVSPLQTSSELSSGNIRQMARSLGRNRRQWAGGCAVYNDPMRGI